MAFEYKTIDVTTKKGHNQAVRLQAKGWKVISGSMYGAVQLEKKKHSKLQN
jgi:hypothetical protein